MIIYHLTCRRQVDLPDGNTRIMSNKVIYHRLDEAKDAAMDYMRRHARDIKDPRVVQMIRIMTIDTERCPNWEKLFPVHDDEIAKKIRSH